MIANIELRRFMRAVEDAVVRTLSRAPRLAFGTTTSTSPFQVTLDGDSAAQAATPCDTYLPKAGDRVVAVVSNREVIVLDSINNA